MKHTIYKGDCLERIKELNNNSVELCITSPPYFNAKEYNKEETNVGNNKDYQDYLNKIESLLKDLYNKIVPGGTVCWNTSPVIDDGKRYGIPFDTDLIFRKVGFEFKEDIVWKKPDGSAKLRCGGWCQNDGRPMTWHPNIATEYIMVYRKPGEREQKEFKPIREYYPEIPKDMLTNVWYFNTETNKTFHDAPFPKELVKRCIVLYSYPGDTILDPFSGTFTTSRVARDLGRNSIGMELDDGYIKEGKLLMGFDQKSLFSDEVYEEK